VFLVPASNCGDLAGLHTRLNLIKVSTLREAISAIENLQTPEGASRVPHC
jgi:PDZ domain-containing protein